MNIAFILPQLAKPGGAERVVVNLANYWQAHGKQVMLICFYKQPSYCYTINKNIQLEYLTTKQAMAFRTYVKCIWRLRKLLLVNKIDIAIGVDIKANLLLRLASYNIRQLVCIATEHRHPPQVPQNKLALKVIRYIYASMPAMVALTAESATWFKQHTRFKRVEVIANPLIYPIAETSPIIKPKTVVDVNKKTLLAVGRLHPQKGFDVLIYVFSELIKKHPNWQLVILGEGKLRESLTQQIARLKLESKVLLPGSVGNLATWYKFADIFVLSSAYEGLPCALMEAMAYGLAVVSFDCESGPRNIIEHNINGLLVESGNIDALVIAIEKLIKDKKLRLHLANNAIKVRNKFNIKNINSKWDNIFNELL